MIALIGSSCRKDYPFTEKKILLPDSVSFHQYIIPIFNANCNNTGCHSGASPKAHLNLSPNVAYSQLFSKSEIDTLQPTQSVLYIELVSTSNQMPPMGRLSDYDIALVLKWIQQKAKNN